MSAGEKLRRPVDAPPKRELRAAECRLEDRRARGDPREDGPERERRRAALAEASAGRRAASSRRGRR
jgi:hypothetical protein